MKRSGLLSLVAASLLLAAPAAAGTRPHYGGTLRVAMREAPMSLDPADSSQGDSPVARSISALIFDTLAILDARGQPQPRLASSWQANPGDQRWQFNIRHGATFQDGSAVSPDAVAASLRAVNPNWKVFAAGEAVVVECEGSTPNLPAILALSRYGIAKRAGGKVTGSGPFAVNHWEPGKKLALAPREDYWDGRAYVDAVEAEMGVTFREQLIALDLGKADVVEVAPEQARRAAVEERRVESSAPAELMALVFTRERQSESEGKLRAALGISIDRDAMNNVLLQGGGEPAGSLLPNWMTGYAFLFPATADLPRARQLRGDAPQGPAWTLGYDTSDPLARVIAERIALNAHDGGLSLQTTNAAAADLRLVRVPLASLDARVALTSLAARLGLPMPKFEGDPAGQMFAAENALLKSQRVIPLLHLRSAAALGTNVRDWSEGRNGDWQLRNVWLGDAKGTEKP